MIRNITRQYFSKQKSLFSIRSKSTAVSAQALEDITALETTEVIEEDDTIREAEINQKRNKSRLQNQHYNVLHNNMPFAKPINEWHQTVKYQRKMFGVYGEASGVYPGMCWPTSDELQTKREYEKVSIPYTVQELMAQSAQKRQEEFDKRQKRQADIVKKYAKLEQWKKDLTDKIHKRESEMRAAKERKDRLVEEVRRHFGFKIDPKDDRFKEMLEQKERAEKKVMKEAKRKVKEAKLMAKLQETKVTPVVTPEPTEK